ncbi:MAG: response regulator [Planctomycetes bacterium]|nr:response regulator [Planctomycetota bacterium]
MTAPHRTSLRRRVTTLCMTLSLLTIVGAGLEAWRRDRQALAATTLDMLETLADMIGANVQVGMTFGATADVTRFLESVVRLDDVDCAAIYDHNDAIVAIAGDASLAPASPGRSRNEGDGWIGVSALTWDDQSLQRRSGHVLVHSPGHQLELRMADNLGALGWSSLLAGVVLVLGLRLLLVRQFAPVGRLLATTQQLRTSRDYRIRAERQHDDEIGELVDSFNAMLAAVEERDHQLADAAARLEDQVRIRTAELENALVAAERATRAKSTFLANMSHEIRTPLNAVLGMTDLAIDTDDPVEKREYLETVRSAGNGLLGVLNDILDFSKIESGKLDIARVPANLEDTVLEAIRPLASRIQSKELGLYVVFAPELAATYELDDLRVRQIVTNLVGNAIKFTQTGAVTVRVSVLDRVGDEDRIEISVQDTGVGIQQDRLQSVFSPFTQADNTITRRFSGTGLGLTICHRLARLMGGGIEVDSELGVGSTFRVELPMRRIDATDTSAEWATIAGCRITALTRSPQQQEALRAVASRCRADLRVVGDAETLRDVIAEGTTDLVLVDDRDPDTDDVFVGTLPRGVGGKRPVVLLTSYQDLRLSIARCGSHDFAGYLPLPLAPRELLQQALTILGKRPTVDRQRDQSPSARTAPAVATRRLRVLVAEDNVVNQKLIERLLQREGYEASITADGKQCVEMFGRQPFDVVLMDVQMPDMSGIEATEWIRAREAGTGARVPILALTANASSEDRDACLVAGMDDVLSKPVSITRFRAALARVAAGLGSDHDRSPTAAGEERP